MPRAGQVKRPDDERLVDRVVDATGRRERRQRLLPVRVVEYRLDDPGRPKANGQVYRLLTTILDPDAAPAAEQAALYHQR